MNTYPATEALNSHFGQDSRQMECKQRIIASNNLYRQMLRTLQSLSDAPEAASTEQLMERQLYFNELQLQIENNDRILNESLHNIAQPNEEIHKLLGDRQYLIEQLLLHNRKVAVQAQAIRSVIADEIRKTTAGHVALKGYRTQDQQRSNGSFRKAM